MSKLDRDFPTGNPHSTCCRWCDQPKLVMAGVLICGVCDGGASKQRPEEAAA